MAKKKPASASTNSNTSSDLTKQIKFWVSPAEHHRLKVAAAILDRPMADLCREVVLEKVNELTSEVDLSSKR